MTPANGVAHADGYRELRVNVSRVLQSLEDVYCQYERGIPVVNTALLVLNCQSVIQS